MAERGTLQKSPQPLETSSGDLAGISFIDSSDFHQETEQLGNTDRNFMEKHKMRNTHRDNSSRPDLHLEVQ